MNRDCQPANCDVTPPSGSLHAVSGERGADTGEWAAAGERAREDFGDGGWVGK